ncbi:unnamed protein product [Nezara viridula]|uniref:Uncharacterized protein n=1 Tax=Nezara viridula TaxID=85310 RepID=A0A9P0MP64_NEZVI|nr:unnamed protein product [Nezara viridula]
MRLLITVVCCLIAIHGTSSVPGFRRKQAKQFFLAQALGQGVQLKKNEVANDGDGLFTENESKAQSAVIDVNIHNINGKIDDSLNNDQSTNQFQSRSKREVGKQNKAVKTYRYESQPSRSRFSYIQKIQKLFEPKQGPTHEILTKHKTLVVENQTDHEEHHSEEIHEHHTTTTSQLKVSKKKRKSKRKLGSQGTTDSEEDYEDEENTEEEVAETDSQATKDASSNALKAENKTKSNKLKSTKIVQPNVVAIKNETQNSLVENQGRTVMVLKKEVNTSEKASKLKDTLSAGINKVKSRKLPGISRTSGIDTTKESPPSAAFPTVINVLKSIPQNNNQPDISTMPMEKNGKISENVPSGGTNLKSFIKNALGLRGNNSPIRTPIQLENPSIHFKNSLSTRNISKIINNIFNNEGTSNNNKTNNRGSFFNVFNSPKTSITSVKEEATKPPRAKVTRFRIPKNKSILPSMGFFHNTDLIKSEEENTEIKHNIEIANSENVFKAPKVFESLSSIPNIPNVSVNVPTEQKSITTTVNKPSHALSQPSQSVMREPKQAENVTTGPEDPRKKTALPRSPRIISNVPDLLPSQPSLTGGNLPSVSILPKMSANVSPSQPSKTRIPKLRTPKSQKITTSKETLFDTDVIDEEEENTEINHNIEIDNSGTVINVPKIKGNLPSVPRLPNVSVNIPTVPKSTKTILNSPSIPSLQQSNTRIPRFRRPKSKITISKKIYDADVINSEENNTEVDHNTEIVNSPTVINDPKIKGNLPLVPNIPNLSANIPTVPKLTTTILNLPSISSSQQSNIRVPKIRRPKSKITISKKIYDADVINSEEGNMEINQNVETVNSGTVVNVPKINGNLPSVPKVPNISANIPTVQKSIPSVQQFNPRFTKFRRPKSKTITISKKIYGTDVVDSEGDNIETNENVEIDNRGTFINAPKVKENLSSVPRIPNVFANIPNISKSTTTILNSPSIPSSQQSNIRIPKFRRPKSKTITSKDILYDTDNIESEEENIDTNHNIEIDNNETIIKVPKLLGNLSSIPNVLNGPGNVPTVPKSTTAIQNSTNVSSSQPTVPRVPKFRRPKSKTITTSKEVLYDIDEVNSNEENTEINNNNQINKNNPISKVAKALKNLPSVPIVPDISRNEPSILKSTIATANRPGVAPLQSSVIREPDVVEDSTTSQKAVGKNSAVPRSPRLIADQPDPENQMQPSLTSAPKFRRPKTKASTTLTEIVSDNNDLSTELYSSENEESIVTNVHKPKVIGNIPYAPRLPQIAVSSVPLVPRDSKLGRPKNKEVPASTVESNDTDGINVKNANTETNNNDGIDNNETHNTVGDNFSTIRNIPKISKYIPNFFKSLTSFGNRPKPVTSQQSAITPKIRPISTSMDIDDHSSIRYNPEVNDDSNKYQNRPIGNLPSVLKEPSSANNLPGVPRSPTTSKDQPINAQSHPILGKISKLQRTKTSPSSTDVINDKSEEMDNVESIDQEADNVPKTFFNLPKLAANFPYVPKLSAITDNLPGIPRSPRIPENEPVNTPQTSQIRIPELKGPKTKPVPTSKAGLNDINDRNSDKDNKKINDENELDNNTDTDFMVTKILNNLPTIPNLTKASKNLLTIPESQIIFEKGPDSKRYSPESNSNINAFTNQPKRIGYQQSIPKLPAVSDILPAIRSFGNWPFFTPSQTLVTEIPKPQKPKNKGVPTSTNSEKYNPEINENSDTVFNQLKISDNQLSIPKMSKETSYLPDGTTAFGNKPIMSSSQTSPIKVPKYGKPKPKTVPISMVESIDTGVTDFEDNITEINDETDNNSQTDFNVLKVQNNLPTNQNIPKVSENLPAIPRSPRTHENEHVNAPSKPFVTEFTKSQKPKAVPKSVNSEKNSPEANDNTNTATDIIANHPSNADVPQNLPAVSKSPTIFGNWPSFAPSQTSPATAPKLNRPNSELVPSSPGSLPNNDDQPGPEVHDSPERFYNPPKRGANLSTPKLPITAYNLPTKTKSPSIFGNWPFFAPSQTSPTRAPKLGSPKSKIVSSTIIGNNSVEPNSKSDSPDINDETQNISTLPKSDVTSAIPRSPSTSGYRPITNLLQPTNKVPKLIRPNSKFVPSFPESFPNKDNHYEDQYGPEDHDSSEPFNNLPMRGTDTPSIPKLSKVADSRPTVSKSPKIFGNWPFFTPSQTSPIRAPKLRKPNSKLVPSFPDSLSDNDDQDVPEGHDSTEPFNNLPKRGANTPSVSKVPQVADSRPTMTKSPTIFGNWPFFAPSQTSPIRVPKLKKPKSELVPSSLESLSDNDDQYSPEDHHKPEYFYNQPKRGANPSSTSKVPVDIHTLPLPAVTKSPSIFGNWPFFAPSNTSPTRSPKFKRPNNNLVPSFPESLSDNDHQYGPEDHESTEPFKSIPKRGANTPSIPKVPKAADSRPTISKSPTIFGNWPFFAPTQTSPVRAPKLRNPKTKSVQSDGDLDKSNEGPNSESGSPDIYDETENISNLPKSDITSAIPRSPATPGYRPITNLLQPSNKVPNLMRPNGNFVPSFPENFPDNDNHNEDQYVPEDHDGTEPFNNLPKREPNIPSISKVPTATDSRPTVSKSPKIFGNWPFFTPSQTSPIRAPKLRKPNSKLVPSFLDSLFDNDEQDVPEGHDSTEPFNKLPKRGSNTPSVPKVPEVADSRPTMTKSPTIFGNWPFFAPSQTSPIRAPKLRNPKTKSVPLHGDIDKSNEEPNSESDSPDINDETENISNLPKSDITSAIPRSPVTQGYRPTTNSIQPSNKAPKITRPNGNFVPSFPESFPDNDYHNENQYGPEDHDGTKPFYNLPKRGTDTPYIPKLSKGADGRPNVPKSSTMFGNWPFFTPSQTSPIRAPKLRKPNSNLPERGANMPSIPKVPKAADSRPTISKSPSFFGNWPFFAPSQTTPIRAPKLRNPKTKSVPLHGDIDKSNEDPNSESDSPDINDETENISTLPKSDITSAIPRSPVTQGYRPTTNSIQPSNKVPKITRPNSIQKVPSTADSRPTITKSPTIFGNWPFFAPSQTSPIRAPKHKRPNSEFIPSSPESLSDNNNPEDDNQNEDQYDPEDHDSPEPFNNLPKRGTNVPFMPKVPAAANSPTINKSPTIFGNWPSFAPSQTSPARAPKLKRPNSELVPSSPGSLPNNDDQPGPEVHDSPERFYNPPKRGANLSTPKLPATAYNLPTITKSPSIFGNWPSFAPSQTSPTRAPKLKRPNSELVPSYPESLSDNDDQYGPEVRDNLEPFYNLPKTGTKLPSTSKIPIDANNLPVINKSPSIFGNWPFFAPSQTYPIRTPKLRSPKSKSVPNEETENFFNQPKSDISSGVPRSPATQGYRPVTITRQPSNIGIPNLKRPNGKSSPDSSSDRDNLNEDQYGPEFDDTMGTFSNQPKRGPNLPFTTKLPMDVQNLPAVKSPSMFENWPLFAPSQTSPTRPKNKAVEPSTGIYHDTNEFNPEVDYTGIDHDYEFDRKRPVFNFPKSADISFVQKVPTSAEKSTFKKRPRDPLQPLMIKVPKPEIPITTSFPNIVYDDNLNYKVGRNVPYLSIKSPKYRRPKFMAVTPSTGVYYADIPSTEMYNTGRIKSGIFPYGNDVSNSELYNKNIASHVSPVIGHVQPVPKLSTSLYFPHTLNIPMVVGNLIPTPKVSLIGGSRRKVPMIIESHPHLVVRSPAYTAMKFPSVRRSKNRMVPSISEISHESDAVDSEDYNRFLRNTSPVKKVERKSRKSQVFPSPPSLRKKSRSGLSKNSEISHESDAVDSEHYNRFLRNTSPVKKVERKSRKSQVFPSPPSLRKKSRSGLSKNRFSSSSKKQAGVLNLETFNTGLTDTMHLQIDEHETLDMVALKKRAGKTIWGIPITNAVGRINYLTVGNRAGDMNFITSRDILGRVEYLYQVRDDTGLSHNLHLKTTGGHLSLVESDYQDGQHSTGFIGYDNTGEYIVPIHFEENQRLVIDPYAHSLRYAVDVHPAYEIVSEVFYYKK